MGLARRQAFYLLMDVFQKLLEIKKGSISRFWVDFALFVFSTQWINNFDYGLIDGLDDIFWRLDSSAVQGGSYWATRSRASRTRCSNSFSASSRLTSARWVLWWP